MAEYEIDNRRDNIVAKYPKLFRKIKYMMCGDGWLDILDDLFSKLEPMISDDETEYCYLNDVKEKFGSLRIYLNYGTSEMFDLIDDAEKLSSVVCENCGKPGELFPDRFCMKVRCKECYDRDE